MVLCIPWACTVDAVTLTTSLGKAKKPFDAQKAMKVYNDYTGRYGTVSNVTEWERRVQAFTSSKKEFRVFLDHGGANFHAEVFYSTANLITELLPSHKLTFYVDKKWAASMGLTEFWNTYAKDGPLQPFDYKFAAVHGYKPLSQACDREFITKGLHVIENDRSVYFDMITQVTISDAMHFGCMPMYVDDPRYVMIIHHAEKEGGHMHYMLEPFRNAYVASSSSGVIKETPNHFTPSLMPIKMQPPDCSHPARFMVQGGIDRRNMTELKVLFTMKPPLPMHVSLRSKEKLHADWFHEDNLLRGDYVQFASMTAFHRAFSGAAFILPLIPGAGSGDPKGYLHNHPTSSIAYAANFGLRVVGHKNIGTAYSEVLLGRVGHYHDNSYESVTGCYRSAVKAFHAYCTEAQGITKSLQGQGKTEAAISDTLVNLWLYNQTSTPAAVVAEEQSERKRLAWEGEDSMFAPSNRRFLR